MSLGPDDFTATQRKQLRSWVNFISIQDDADAWKRREIMLKDSLGGFTEKVAGYEEGSDHESEEENQSEEPQSDDEYADEYADDGIHKCENSCSKKMHCFKIRPWFACGHFQCLSTTLAINYCINCGNAERVQLYKFEKKQAKKALEEEQARKARNAAIDARLKAIEEEKALNAFFAEESEESEEEA